MDLGSSPAIAAEGKWVDFCSQHISVMVLAPEARPHESQSLHPNPCIPL